MSTTQEHPDDEPSPKEQLQSRIDELEALVEEEREEDGDALWVYERVLKNLREEQEVDG